MRAESRSPHSILDKYTALVDISVRLNSEKNFDQLLKLIADEATKHVDAERATIFMLASRQQELIEENQHLRKEVEERFTSKSILGTSPKINEIRSIIERTAETGVSALVTGENGTGKELSARAIHYMSSRRAKPFVAVNCAALPE